MAFVQILLFLALGLFLRQFQSWAKKALPLLIQTVLWACIPALALLKLPALQLTPSTVFPALLAWGIFAGAYVLSQWGVRRGLLSPASATCLCLTMGLGNTSFVGFPLIAALLGNQALPSALIMDQAGSFLILGTWGLFCLAQAAGERPSARAMVSKLLRFPPFLAFGTGLTMWALGLTLTGPLHTLANWAAAALAPPGLDGRGAAIGFQTRTRADTPAQPGFGL